jgi:hypothetical protein
MKIHVSLMIAALLLTACGNESSSPTQPSSPPAPTPSTDRTTWSVTQRFASVTGPDNCWVREQRQRWTGAVFPNLPMTVVRSGATITLEGSFFQVNYAGTLSGRAFTANGNTPLEGGGTPCQDGTSFVQMPGTSTLTGSFAADDQSLTASEVNAYRLTSGEAVTYTWEWQATRQ